MPSQAHLTQLYIWSKCFFIAQSREQGEIELHEIKDILKNQCAIASAAMVFKSFWCTLCARQKKIKKGKFRLAL